ncbi:MAG: NPCBM/NEW2 domain-containing protein, partial [Planctomycetes bacterium]|nr:NPCBM/NEW2 domain-containing protein [Planctomycetota bacterium]
MGVSRPLVLSATSIPFIVSAAFGSAPRAGASEEYLSDILDRGIVRHAQAWGALGIDTAVTPPDGRAAMPLRIGERTFAKGLGSHANGEIVIDLAGRYETFEAVAGVAWQGGGRGSVIFRVIVDGTVRFESRRMTDSDPGVPVKVPVAGARELRLVAADAGDGIACDCANWAEARLARDPASPAFGAAAIAFGDGAAPAASASTCGFTVVASGDGPQIAVTEADSGFVAAVRAGESIEIAIPVAVRAEALALSAEIEGAGEGEAEAALALDGETARRRAGGGEVQTIEVAWRGSGEDHTIRMTTRCVAGEAAVRWREVRLRSGDHSYRVDASPRGAKAGGAALPALRAPIERALIEWDWRMQDGLGTRRAPSTYAEAIERTIARGSRLLADLEGAGATLAAERAEWDRLRALAPRGESGQERLWREVHELRRRIALRNPLAATGPIAFIEQVPGAFSHQLTQYYGRYARPGGGVFVLERPGESMECRPLAANLPSGSAQHLDVSYDGRRILFSFCETEGSPADPVAGARGRYYHLYEVGADGSGLRRLTDGPFDDFAPRYLPDGRIVFISTRRRG